MFLIFSLVVIIPVAILLLSCYLCKQFFWDTVLPEAQPKGRLALFQHSKGLKHQLCRAVPLGWQLRPHFKVAPFVFLSTVPWPAHPQLAISSFSLRCLR